MEDLVGKKVRGFKFEGDYNESMDKHIGEIGEIISVSAVLKRVRIEFATASWNYPVDQIEKHLVKEVMKKFKIGDRVQCVENGAAIKSHALGYKPGKKFIVDFIQKGKCEHIYFPKDDRGVYECDLILVKKLPKSFACTNTNQELWDKYIKWLNKKFNASVVGKSLDWPYYGISIYEELNNYSSEDAFDTILSLEEWDEIVNGTETKTKETMKNYTITREQLQKIYDVACSEWKETILKYSRRNPFGNTIEFTQTEVSEMFKAASLSQTAVLANIFGKQAEELNFKSDDINFKVDGISVFGESNKSGYDSFIGLPSTDKYKSSFFLNTDYDWTLDDGVLTVTRKK
jgi:hypothetical protein